MSRHDWLGPISTYPVGLEPITASDLLDYTELRFVSAPKTYMEIWCFEVAMHPSVSREVIEAGNLQTPNSTSIGYG